MARAHIRKNIARWQVFEAKLSRIGTRSNAKVGQLTVLEYLDKAADARKAIADAFDAAAQKRIAREYCARAGIWNRTQKYA